MTRWVTFALFLAISIRMFFLVSEVRMVLDRGPRTRRLWGRRMMMGVAVWWWSIALLMLVGMPDPMWANALPLAFGGVMILVGVRVERIISTWFQGPREAR